MIRYSWNLIFLHLKEQCFILCYMCLCKPLFFFMNSFSKAYFVQLSKKWVQSGSTLGTKNIFTVFQRLSILRYFCAYIVTQNYDFLKYFLVDDFWIEKKRCVKQMCVYVFREVWSSKFFSRCLKLVFLFWAAPKSEYRDFG